MAEDFYRKAVAMEQRCSATGAAELTRHDYAWFMRTLGRYDEAEPLARAVHAVWGQAPDDQVHTGVAYSSQNLGAILLETGRTDEAATLLTFETERALVARAAAAATDGSFPGAAEREGSAT